jgi:hypothetical protein
MKAVEAGRNKAARAALSFGEAGNGPRAVQGRGRIDLGQVPAEQNELLWQQQGVSCENAQASGFGDG